MSQSGNIAVTSGATSGAAASGSPVSGNPVLVAGSDGTNARTVSTDSTGMLVVSPPGAKAALAGSALVQVTATSANQANVNAVATLPATGLKFTYISGFICTASGSTAGLAVTGTITGLISGTMNFTFTFPAGVLVPAQPLVVTFSQPIVSSAANTAIVVTLPAGGAGTTNATVSAWGFQY